MTIHIQMLQDIATHARAMADSMQAIVDDCAEQLANSEYVPEGFGTGDIVIVADGVIEVVDFKGGRGVRVEANRNSQLMLYVLPNMWLCNDVIFRGRKPLYTCHD